MTAFTCARALGLAPVQTGCEQNQKSLASARFFKSFRPAPCVRLRNPPPLPLATLRDSVGMRLSTLCTCTWMGVSAFVASRQVCVCVCVCEPGVCYSLCSHTVFHQASSCSPQTVGIRFHSLRPPSAAARGWMISNTWEPWEPTRCWNNRGPVSIGALEEDETAGGDDVRVIHTHPRFLRPFLALSLTSAKGGEKKTYCMMVQTNLP